MTIDSTMLSYTRNSSARSAATAQDVASMVGRSMEQEAVGYFDGADRYEFVRSDPTDLADPLGLGAWGVPNVSYGKPFSFYDPDFLSEYVIKAGWGQTKALSDGSIDSVVHQLELPPCVNDADRARLQKLVDEFNDAELQHEEQVQRWFMDMLALGSMGGMFGIGWSPDDVNELAKYAWGDTEQAERDAKETLYTDLKKAFDACSCPGNRRNQTNDAALQKKINTYGR